VVNIIFSGGSFFYSFGNSQKLLSLSKVNAPNAAAMVSLVSNDCQRVEDAAPYLAYVILAPIDTIVSLIFVAWHIGIFPCMAGLAVLMIFILAAAPIGNLFQKLRIAVMKERDDRMRQVADLIKGIDIVRSK